MAILHTELPSKRGELDLAHRLQAIDDPSLHLWFALEYLPGILDIDLLLLHERAGIFVIEVKAIPLKMIKSFGLSKCEIEGRTDNRPPHLQAGDARWKLKDLLDRQLGRRTPRIEATACFPLITRREWNSHFGVPSHITGEYSDAVLFDCDLSAGAKTFEDRLQRIWYNPPARTGAKRPFSCDQSLIDQITKIVAPMPQKPLAAPSDYERLRVIEGAVESEAIQDCPINKQVRILYKGRPGTGKTFRLVTIGMAQAIAGKSKQTMLPYIFLPIHVQYRDALYGFYRWFGSKTHCDW
jgi:hypothetical protein